MASGAGLRPRASKPAPRPRRKTTAPVCANFKAATTAYGPDDDVEMTDAVEEEQPQQWLRTVLDYGTKNQSAAISVRTPASPAPTPFDILEPTFAKRLHDTPQIIGFRYSEDGTRQVLWGSAVIDALGSSQLQPEDTIEMWKLALYKDHASSATVKQIEEQMARHGLDIVELIALHLEYMLPSIRQELKADVLGWQFDFESLPMELWITVPQMWEPPACRTMVNAVKKVAKKAGVNVKWAKLIFEAECAAAFHLESVKTSLTAGYAEGDEIIVCDGGGATVDLQCVEYASDPADGAKVLLKHSGKAIGALAGSELVNEAFREYLKTEAPKKEGSDFSTICANLALTEMACLRRASDEFEHKKKQFGVAGPNSYLVAIVGDPGAIHPFWIVEVSREIMKGFFGFPLRTIKSCIRELAGRKTKKVLFTGGFGRSEYLMSELKDYFDFPIDDAYIGGRSDRAVSNGGMLRWPEIENKGFDENSSFGIAQEEVYDDKIHPDAAMDVDRQCESPFSNVVVVQDRWLPLVTKDIGRGEGVSFMAQEWQYSIKPIEDRELEIPVYWMRGTLRKSMPILKGSRWESGLRDDIELWDTVTITLPNLNTLGFRPITLEKDDGRPLVAIQHEGDVYQFYWRITLRGEGANMSFVWEMAKRGKQPFDAHGRRLSIAAQLLMPVAATLTSEKFDPFARNNY